MLQNSFIHVPGVSMNSERKIWKSGISCWSRFLEDSSSVCLPQRKRECILDNLKISQERLGEKDSGYFQKLLPPREHWRMYPEFRDSVAFLDIETTGLGQHHDITLIGIFDGKKTHSYILGDNLKKFEKDIQKYKLLVTFNGACFDIPFILSKFNSLDLAQTHIDLRWTLRRIGLSGGLKSIEQQLGLSRSEETENMSGWDAVRLWKRYQRGDSDSLDLLLQYNREDVVNLKKILEMCYTDLVKVTLNGT